MTSTATFVPSRRAKADLNTVLAITGSPYLIKRANADVRVVGRQVRAKAHQALHRNRGKRCTVEQEVTEGVYSQLPVWSHRDQWLSLVQMTIEAWFPEQIHRRVRAATLLKFAALVAAFADDATGRDCRRVYTELARDMAVSAETVRKCWRALERLGLAVQVERSVAFTYNERMRIWRLERSKQRGMTPVYALVVPAAYAQAMVTGEHPADLLAYAEAPDTAEPVTPVQKLATALSNLRSAISTPVVSVAAEAPAVSVEDCPETPAPVEHGQIPTAPVDNSRRDPFRKLENVDILGLPRSGGRCTSSTSFALVDLVPHGVKSTASRAHNQDGSPGKPSSGGTAPTKGAQKRCAGRGGWFGPHRDIAVHLTRRVLWLRGVQPGRIAPQLKRFTVPGLPKVWRPEDFVTALDQINRRQNRYSPGANTASRTEVDQGHVERASAGAVRSPQGLLKWYLEQLDPANDHPRFELDQENERFVAAAATRRAQAAQERASARSLVASSAATDWRAARQALTKAVHSK